MNMEYQLIAPLSTQDRKIRTASILVLGIECLFRKEIVSDCHCLPHVGRRKSVCLWRTPKLCEDDEDGKRALRQFSILESHELVNSSMLDEETRKLTLVW